MADKKLRWGVLGTARIADSVIAGMRKAGNSELAAVASRDLEKARAWANERGVPNAFGSYEDMLSSDGIDAVYVPLPNALHKEWSIKAAEQGKHVLCEKPLAANAAEVEEIVAAARKSRVKVMEAFMYRFHPQTRRIVQLVKDGAVGEPKIVRATFDFYLNRPNDVRWSRELSGGALMDVGCYCVNLSNLVLGVAPEAVTASAVWAPSGVDMSLVGTLEYPGGVLGAIDCSFQVGVSNQQGFTISGTGGRISTAVPFRMGEEETRIMVDKADSHSEPVEVAIPGANEYHLMVEHFADAVLNGTELSYPLEESLRNMRVLDALRVAAESGRRIAVNA